MAHINLNNLTISFIRAFAVFCGSLGLIWGAVKLLGANAKAIYAVPAVTLVYLAIDLLISLNRRPRKEKKE